MQNWQGIVGGAIAAIVLLIAFNSFPIVNPGEAGVLSIIIHAHKSIVSLALI